MDSTFSWYHGLASFPLLPSSQEEEDEEDEGLSESMKETAKEKEERKSDYDVARQDVVKVTTYGVCVSAAVFSVERWFLFQGLLKMKLLPRLRYILEVIRPSPRAVQDILLILTRVARHSSSAASQVRCAWVT